VDFGRKIKFGARLRRVLDRSLLGLKCTQNGAVTSLPPFCIIFGIMVLAGNSSQDLDFKELRY